ncbi:hypothetical protein [Chryseobacterium indoltheticum]|uniref:Uncharacterized protein n=1 Tax=Chryseobacterium limigenitum TaxID=1612149 RepID=A0A1K2ILP5_9FLAO|nr:hypothetical protein [Chryseobacterium indoltheticum]SFZ93120.1 hypothetical protein SAMN05216324_104145 [Chryseobacterium limigenitum]
MDKFYTETLHKLETTINELEIEADYSIQRIEAVMGRKARKKNIGMKADRENTRPSGRFYFKWFCQLTDDQASGLDYTFSSAGVLLIKITIMKDHLHTSIGNDELFSSCSSTELSSVQ